MRVTFLGTSSAVPTPERRVTSIAVSFGREYILLDVGECAQIGLMKSGLGFGRLKRIFISHLHGDHFFGLFPLIQTLGILGRRDPLEIYAPPDLEAILDLMMEKEILIPGFKIIFHPIIPNSRLKFGEYSITAFPVIHGDAPTYGFKVVERAKRGRFDAAKAEELGVPPELRGVLIKGFPIRLSDGRIVRPQDLIGPPRPGRCLVYSSDSRPCRRVVEEARGCDLLIHDSTFRSDMADRAESTGHSTVKEACEIASAAGVGLLVLTHFSARYRESDLREIEEEARKLFSDVIVARDLLSIDLEDLPARKKF